MLVTKNGYALRFNIEEVPIVGAKAAGVKAINLKKDDVLATAFIANTDSLYILTQRGALKRMAVADIPVTSRANRGLQVLRDLKSKPHRVFQAGPVFGEQPAELDLFSSDNPAAEEEQILSIVSSKGTTYEVNLADLGLSERTSNGSFISDTISDEEVFSANLK